MAANHYFPPRFFGGRWWGSWHNLTQRVSASQVATSSASSSAAPAGVTAHAATVTQRAVTGADSSSGTAAHYATSTDRATTSADSSSAAITRAVTASDRATTSADSSSALTAHVAALNERATTSAESSMGIVTFSASAGDRAVTSGDSATASLLHIATASDRAVNASDSASALTSHTTAVSQRAVTAADNAGGSVAHAASASETSKTMRAVPWFPLSFVRRGMERVTASLAGPATASDTASGSVSFSASASDTRSAGIGSVASTSASFRRSAFASDGNPRPRAALWYPRGFSSPTLRQWSSGVIRLEQKSFFPRGFGGTYGFRRWMNSATTSGTDYASARVTHVTAVSDALQISDRPAATWSFNLVGYEDAPNTTGDNATALILKTGSAFERAPGSFGTNRWYGRFRTAFGMDAWTGTPYVTATDGPVANVLRMVGKASELPAPPPPLAWYPRGFGLADEIGRLWSRSGRRFQPIKVDSRSRPWYPRGFGLSDAIGSAWARSGRQFRPFQAADAVAPWYPPGFGLSDLVGRAWSRSVRGRTAFGGGDFATNILRMVGIANDRAVRSGDTATARIATVIASAGDRAVTSGDSVTAQYVLSRIVTERATTMRDSVAVTSYTPAIAYAPPIPAQQNAIPDALITVYDSTMTQIYALDASTTDFIGGHIQYEDRPEGCGSATLTLGLYYEEVNNRGYWQGENVVEISSGDCVLVSTNNANASKLYVDSNAPFDTRLGEDNQQAYIRLSGAQFSARMNVRGVGEDAGGQFIVVDQPMDQNGVSYPLPSYPAGSIVGRRRYVGRVRSRSRVNSRDRKATVQCVGLSTTFSEANGDFAVNAQDVGGAMYACIQQFASRWPFLSVRGVNFPAIGSLYSGSKTKSSLESVISDMISAITTGDRWAMRIGHDRIPRLARLYRSSDDSYAYNAVLPQNVYEFEPLNVTTNDENTASIFNTIEVIGDTDEQTKQPVSAIAYDANSIALYGRQIDAPPVTNSACKTTADCLRHATTLLREASIATASNSFRVYTRNDRRDMINTPGGIRQGDVVRGVQNVVVTRFNSSGTGKNYIPDSEFAYVGAVWTGVNVTPTSGAGFGGSAAIVAAANGSDNRVFSKQWVDLAPGEWWTLSVNVDATNAQAGSPGVVLVDAASGATIAKATQAAGVVGQVYATFQVPAGVRRATVIVTTNGASSSLLPNTIKISRPMLARGTTLTSYEPNYAAPPAYGLVASVVSHIDMSGGGSGLDRWQEVSFAAVEPDWSATMAERTNAVTTAITANRATGAHIDSYCVSSEAFPPTWDGLRVHPPAFAALFAKGSSPVIVGNNYFSVFENETNFAWLNPDGSWTVQQDRTVIPGAILYALFQTSAAQVIGYYPRASVGLSGIGAAALATTAFAAPVFASDPVITSAPTPYPTDANVEVLGTLRNIPPGAVALVFLFREHVDIASGQSPNPWLPDAEIGLLGSPVPTTPQTVDFTYAQLAKGRVYDFAVQYRGTSAYGQISGTIGSPNVRTNGFVAQSILVTAQYLISNAAFVPYLTAKSVTIIRSPDNINAAIQVRFRFNNQPTDHSLKKIRLWAKADSSSIYGDAGAVAARNINDVIPSPVGDYEFTAILPIGTGYTFAMAAEDIRGAETRIEDGFIATIDAEDVVLDPAQLSQRFQNILNSSFYGLQFADTGELIIPAHTEVCPSQRIFSLSLVQPSTGSVDSSYDTTQAITFRMRARNSYDGADPGRWGLVFFADAASDGSEFNNGYLVQAEPDGVGIYQKAAGYYKNIAYFYASAYPVPRLLDGKSHELKVIVSPVLQNERYLQNFGSASGQIRSVISGMIRFTIYIDGTYCATQTYQTGATALSGHLGPRNSSPSLVYVDKSDFDVRVGSSTVSYNELDAVVRGVIKSPTDVSASSSPSNLKDGTVGQAQALPSNGNNILYNPSGSRNLAGWSVYGSAMRWESAGYYGGSIHGIYDANNGIRIDEVLQQLLQNKNNNGPIYPYTTYTASGRVHINSVSGTVAVDVIDGANYLGGKTFTASGDYAFEFTFSTKDRTDIFFRLHFTGVAVDVYFFALQLEPGTVATLFNDDATAGVSTVTQLPGGGIDLTNPYNTNYNLDQIPTGINYGKVGTPWISGNQPLVDLANPNHVNKYFNYISGQAQYAQLDPYSVGKALDSVGNVTGPGATIYSTGNTPALTFTVAAILDDQANNRPLRSPARWDNNIGCYVGDFQIVIPSASTDASWFVSFDHDVYGTNTSVTLLIYGAVSNVVLSLGQAATFYNIYEEYTPKDEKFNTYRLACGSSFSGSIKIAKNQPPVTLTVSMYVNCFSELIVYQNGSTLEVRNTKNQTRLANGKYLFSASRYA